MPKQLVVPGHTLPFEGRVLVYGGFRSSHPAKGKCSCGAQSRDELPTAAARQRWHREHKQEVVDARNR